VDFKIVWTLRSREDLRDIATFIAKDNPPAALKLGEMIFDLKVAKRQMEISQLRSGWCPQIK
jgi:plasmid stabilization system protein ParE